jgi:hypothetical protein
MSYDVVILGGGAAGLMCAIEAGKRGRKTLVLDHASKIADKIRISGGGRCNFTNLHSAPDKFLSQNPHFCTSALKRYTQNDFIDLVKSHGIAYHEKTLGQLFCDNSAQDIIQMLLDECTKAGVKVQNETPIESVRKNEDGSFTVISTRGNYDGQSLVIATGGPSIPKMGSSTFGYEVANQFDIAVVPPRAGLVPLVFDPIVLAYTKELSGISVDPVEVKSVSGKTFREALLFTHKGISGPAILQISSYWQIGEAITINLAPDIVAIDWLKEQKHTQPKSKLSVVLSYLLPKALGESILAALKIEDGRIADQTDKTLQALAKRIGAWEVKPSGSEGYRTAEVTLGGVDTNELSSKTMESRKVPGLYFIGEVVDVTGHLGGYNFQWAWSSGWCAGQFV